MTDEDRENEPELSDGKRRRDERQPYASVPLSLPVPVAPRYLPLGLSRLFLFLFISPLVCFHTRAPYTPFLLILTQCPGALCIPKSLYALWGGIVGIW